MIISILFTICMLFSIKFLLMIKININIIPLKMISQNLGRVKKSSSLMVQRENKENCSNNVQQYQAPLAKLGKIRESFAHGHHHQDKIVNSLIIDSKE